MGLNDPTRCSFPMRIGTVHEGPVVPVPSAGFEHGAVGLLPWEVLHPLQVPPSCLGTGLLPSPKCGSVAVPALSLLNRPLHCENLVPVPQFPSPGPGGRRWGWMWTWGHQEPCFYVLYEPP